MSIIKVLVPVGAVAGIPMARVMADVFYLNWVVGFMVMRMRDDFVCGLSMLLFETIGDEENCTQDQSDLGSSKGLQSDELDDK